MDGCATNESSKGNSTSCNKRSNQFDPITCSSCCRVAVKREGEPRIFEGPNKKIKLEFPVEVKQEVFDPVNKPSTSAANAKVEDVSASQSEISKEKGKCDTIRSVTSRGDNPSRSNCDDNNSRVEKNPIVPYRKTCHSGSNRGRRRRNRPRVNVWSHNNYCVDRNFHYFSESNFSGYQENYWFNHNEFYYNQNPPCSNMINNNYFMGGQFYFPGNEFMYQNWNGNNYNDFQNYDFNGHFQCSQDRANFNENYSMTNSLGRSSNQNQVNRRQKYLLKIEMKNNRKIATNKSSLENPKGRGVSHSTPSPPTESVRKIADSISVAANPSSSCERPDVPNSSNSEADGGRVSAPGYPNPNLTSTTTFDANDKKKKEESANEDENIEFLKVLCHACSHSPQDSNTSKVDGLKKMKNSCKTKTRNKENTHATSKGGVIGSNAVIEGKSSTSRLVVKSKKKRKSERKTFAPLKKVKGKEAKASKAKKIKGKIQNDENLAKSKKGPRVCEPDSENRVKNLKNKIKKKSCNGNSPIAKQPTDVANSVTPLEICEGLANPRDSGKTLNLASKPDRKKARRNIPPVKESCKNSAVDSLPSEHLSFEKSYEEFEDHGGLSAEQKTSDFSSNVLKAAEEPVLLDDCFDSNDADDLRIVFHSSAPGTSLSRLISKSDVRSLSVRSKKTVPSLDIIRVINIDDCKSEIKSEENVNPHLPSGEFEVGVSETEKKNDVLENQEVDKKPVVKVSNDAQPSSSGTHLRSRIKAPKIRKPKINSVRKIDAQGDEAKIICESGTAYDPDDDCIIVEANCAAKISPEILAPKEEKKPMHDLHTTAVAEVELYDEIPDFWENSKPKNYDASDNAEARVKVEQKPDPSCLSASCLLRSIAESYDFSAHENDAKIVQ